MWRWQAGLARLAGLYGSTCFLGQNTVVLVVLISLTDWIGLLGRLSWRFGLGKFGEVGKLSHLVSLLG